jgi:hypothetical protein
MKPQLLSLIVITAAAWTGQVTAQEPPRDHPREEKKEDGRKDAELRERMQNEQRAFREKMEARMKEAMQEAAKLEADGHKEEAEALRAKAKERLEAAVKEHQAMMQRKTQAAMRERASGERRPDGPPPAELENKLKHVEQAVAHLREAGMPDAAESIARIAERLRQEMRTPVRPRPDEARRTEPLPRPDENRRPDEALRPVQQLEAELDALRREVRELHEAVRRMNAGKPD